MTQITNNHATALALPSGQVLEPGQPTDVTDWDTQKKNAVVQAWLKAKVLSDGSAPAKGSSTGGADDDRDALIEQLDRLGVNFDRRSGVAKLRTLLAEAQKQPILYGSDSFPANVEIDGKPVQLGDIVRGAHTASGLSIEAWNALAADDRDARLTAEVERLQAVAKA